MTADTWYCCGNTFLGGNKQKETKLNKHTGGYDKQDTEDTGNLSDEPSKVSQLLLREGVVPSSGGTCTRGVEDVFSLLESYTLIFTSFSMSFPFISFDRKGLIWLQNGVFCCRLARQ